MRIKIIILYILLSICVYAAPYSNYSNDPPMIEFKSTSSYTYMTSYETVRPLNMDGTVSMEYTTNSKPYRPQNVRRGLDLDDRNEPNASLVPIGDPPILILILLLLYIGYDILVKSKLKK